MVPKIDDCIEWKGKRAHYWEPEAQGEHPLVMECRTDPALIAVAELARQAQALLADANSYLEAQGYRHRLGVAPWFIETPKRWRDDSLTVQQALDCLAAMPAGTMLTHTFRAPWAPNARYDGEGDPGCEGVHFELLPGPVPAEEFAARLRCAMLTDRAEIARVLGVDDGDTQDIGGNESGSAHVYTITPSRSSRRDYDNHALTFAALEALVVRETARSDDEASP